MELLFDRNFIPGATLCEEESLHCVKVMRHKAGDEIHVTDGEGHLYVCALERADSRGCELTVKSCEDVPTPSHFLHVAVAPTKNIDRLEWFVEKAVEFGISRITPIYCEHSERNHIRIDRLERIAIAACKQSLKCHAPVISAPIACSELIAQSDEQQKFILHCGATPKPHLWNAATTGVSSIILIGPEGDFSEKEIHSALSYGFTECTLGPERLRTETAAVAATHIIDLKNAVQ